MADDKKEYTIDDFDSEEVVTLNSPEELEQLRQQSDFELRPEFQGKQRNFVGPEGEELPFPLSEKLLRNVTAGATGMAHGVTLGLGDEAVAGLQSLGGEVPYEVARDRLRQYYQGVKEDYPASTMLGEATGSFAIPAGPLVRGFRNARTIPKVAAEMAEAGVVTGAANIGHGNLTDSIMNGEFQGLPDTPGTIMDPADTTLLATALPGVIRGGAALATGAGQVAKAIIPGVKPVVEGFKEGQKGYKIFDRPLTEHKTIVAMNNMAKTVSNKIGEEGKILPELVKNATEQGGKVNLNAVDDALNKIQELKTSKATDKFLTNELEQIEEFLLQQRHGREVDSVIPAHTTTQPGKVTPSSEEVVAEQLRQKQALGQAAEDLGVPKATATQTGKEKFVKQKITAEEQVKRQFSPETVQVEGVDAVRYINPNDMVDVEIIRSMKPGDIKTIETVHGPVMGYMLPSGKLVGKTIPQTPINRAGTVTGPKAASQEFKTTTIPEQAENIRLTPSTEPRPAFVTGKPGEVGPGMSSPQQAYDFRKTLNKLLGSRGRDAALKDPASREIVQSLMRQLDEGIETTAPGFKNQLHSVSSLNQAIEDLGVKGEGFTRAQAAEDSGSKLFSKAAATTGEGAGSAQARFDVRQFFKDLKQVDPELAATLKPKFDAQTKRYGLSTDIRQTPLQSANPDAIYGSFAALLARGGAYGGYASRKINGYIQQLAGKGTAAEPLIKTLQKLTDSNITVPARNALIFKISQDPSSRELLREVGFEEDELIEE